MQPVNTELIESVDRYIQELFVPPDASLSANIADADAAGLPAIQVTPNQGKLLYLLARMCGAGRILEIGTLGGYSTTWLARALPHDGALLTLERNPDYAAVARRNLDRSGVGARVEIRIGVAANSLRSLIGAGTAPFDLIFIDADKAGYPEYLDLALQLSRPGTVILADNVIRHGNVLDSVPSDPTDAGARAYNRLIAAPPRLESIILPMVRHRLDGMAMSLVKPAN